MIELLTRILKMYTFLHKEHIYEKKNKKKTKQTKQTKQQQQRASLEENIM